MNIPTRKGKTIWHWIPMLLGIAALTVIVSTLETPPRHVSAHSGDIFGPACGEATIDGHVDPAEWSSASSQTFQMNSPNIATPLTATLNVMNSADTLYLGITINDDEFSTYAEFLPAGDGFRIDFDNDHGGSLFTLNDDVLTLSAGLPQFSDNYIYVVVTQSTENDALGGGTSDGAGAANRVGDLNHFELEHPLCSGDSLDYCLHPGDTIGFRLEYLDAQGDGSFGGTLLFPGFEDTSEADIVIGQCSVADFFVHLPLLLK
jgi:hypothetical protein